MFRLTKHRVAVATVAVAALVGAGLVAAAAFDGNVGPVAKVVAATPARADSHDSAAYEKCLNEHGWPVGPGLSIDPNGTAPSPGVIDAAVAACKNLDDGVLEALRPSDEQLQQLRDQSNRFVACMSAHGVDVGAPHVFRDKIGIGVGFPGYNPSAPGFDDAYAACKTIMNVFG